MYLRDLAASLGRRWQLFCVALLLTAAACYGVFSLVGPTYVAKGGVVLLPPPDPENPDANRFLALSSLKQATDVLVRSLGSEQTHGAVAGRLPGADYTVEPDLTTSAPVLVVRATGRSPHAASAMLDGVLSRVPVNLSKLQGALDIAEGNQIVYEVLATDQTPAYAAKGQLRACAALGALLFAGLCLVIGALDGTLLRRQERKAGIRAIPDAPGQPRAGEAPATAELGDQEAAPRRRGGRLS
jgi:hypothetical protein